MIIWPSSLPALPTKDYSEDKGVLILRTPMDAGPAKQRRRGKKPDVMNVTYEMTADQVQAFDTFVEDTLMGVKRYQVTHPRTLSQVEVRIIPSDDGKLYSLNFVTFATYNVSMQLEVLP